CRQALNRFCSTLMLEGVAISVTEQRVIWDARSFGRCFRTWIDQACTPPYGDLPDRPECRTASKGTVPPGGMCTTAFDCAEVENSEVQCTFPESGPGTCTKLGQRGTPCAFSNTCESALRCREGQCQPPGQANEACRFEDDCVPGLLCNDAGVCINPLLPQRR
ncbi:MAG: hypothetical protein AAFS10_21535, partial [Myxococcota bacterium]